MKKFFEDIKKDIKFKSVGPGKKLTDDSSSSRGPAVQSSGQAKPQPAPTEGAQRAGAAALARIEHKQWPSSTSSQSAIRNQVKKELEAEATAGQTAPECSKVPVKEDPACLSVSGVYFTCPLTGTTLTKNEKETRIKEAILKRLEDDPVESSILMMYTFNKDREKVKAGVDIISKYIDNILNNPTEEKYRKIKQSNKVFQEKVSSMEGSSEFLQALGFQSAALPVDGQEHSEEFLLLEEQDPAALEVLREARDRLQGGEPVRARLDRRTQAFCPSPHATRFELPPDFYNLTAEELQREQQLRTEAVERSAMLRTKAMRERDEQRERKRHNYTLLRVRLPDGTLLQGTFMARERVGSLFQFVRESLVDGWQPFELVAPGGQRLEEEEMALNECGLVPSALLSLTWDDAVQADMAATGQSGPRLRPELLENMQTIS
ncbi:hypothetical protein SKAU_G00117650 [Synaphobranchus kaupii]|uniref:UBX domain-containing protein 6 n=1 Tax=Synaphobranchus kaupii TaxID=118154 RepID=A0A9Q1FN62_SYNKA|nr:hypothetical protein SKAU_G00117650 [Synaphobranchus kaupii]